jgi:large subunit ribosomal protein L31
MKTNIHPNYTQVTITCNSCSATFTVGSTISDNITIDTCNNCHPFFTGKQKIVDIANKAKDFAKRQATANTLKQQIQAIKVQREEKKKTQQGQNVPLTLKDMVKMLKQGEKA